ncbi:hypothetical protein KL944_004665 [Ogataea haglerorum]|nr:hypothetical protein KL944_004665 [Ogataea haglerorum]
MTTAAKDESLLDIGRLCSVCQRVDFLPFTCPHCSTSFCTDHRLDFNEHNCRVSGVAKPSLKPTSNVSSASLFPDLDRIRKQAEADHKQKQTLASTTNHAALTKLKAFVSYHKSKSKPFFRIRKDTPASRLVELSKLKNQAIGDPKIPASQRVYIMCQYVPDETKFGDAQLTEQKAIFVSKIWPVGRLLDSAADLLKIRNDNNRTTESIKRLTIFRRRRRDEAGTEEYVYVPANGRVVREVCDGDLVYIVRGAQV